MKGKRWLWLLTVLVIPIGYAGVAITGSLEPTSAPGSTMRTLEELQPSWGKKITNASERFEVVLGGAGVLDKETGLVWEQSPDTTPYSWYDAIRYCYNVTSGTIAGGGIRKGWRLPAVEELTSLLDMSVLGSPKLPVNHPFTNVQSSLYWSATTDANTTTGAWDVNFNNGAVNRYGKAGGNYYVWCVRGGHGHDGQ